MKTPTAPLLLEREDLIAHLIARFEGTSAAPFHLYGSPGVGKSALAHELLERWQRSKRPGLFLRWSLLDEESLSRALAQLPERARAATLLVIDDARDIPHSVVDAIAHPRLLLVARRQLSFSSIPSAEVPALSLDASRELLRHRIDPRLLSTTSDASIDMLLGALGGIPRAIELATTRAQLMGIEPLFESMREDLGILSQQIADRSTRHRSIRHNMQEVWSSLSDQERTLLHVCNILDERFTLKELTLASNFSLPVVLSALDGLVASSALITHTGAPIQFEIMPMMRTFIAQHVRPAPEISSSARARVVALVDRHVAEIMQDISSARVGSSHDLTARLCVLAARSALARSPVPAEGALTASRCLLAAGWLAPGFELWGKIIEALDVLLATTSFDELRAPERALVSSYRALLSWGTSDPPRPMARADGTGPMIAWAQLLGSWSAPALEPDCAREGLPAELHLLLALERCRASTSPRSSAEVVISELTRIARAWPHQAPTLLGCIYQGLQAETYIRLGMAGRARPLVHDRESAFASHPVLRVWWARLFARALMPHEERRDEIKDVLQSARANLPATSRVAMMLDLELARFELVSGRHTACLQESARVLEHVKSSTDPLFMHAFTLLFLSEILAAYEIENTTPGWIHARLNTLGYPVEFVSWWESARSARVEARMDTNSFDMLRLIASSIYGHGITPTDRTPSPLRAHHELWSDSPDVSAWRDMERWRATEDVILASMIQATDILLTHSKHRAVALALFTPNSSQEAIFDMENHRVKLGQAEWIDFSKRPKMRRLLEALLVAHERGELVTSEELIEYVWSDEVVRYDSALSRLYNLLSTTRKLGLKSLLAKEERGYGFSSEWSVRVI